MKAISGKFLKIFLIDQVFLIIYDIDEGSIFFLLFRCLINMKKYVTKSQH
jgi:hypothetical protein